MSSLACRPVVLFRMFALVVSLAGATLFAAGCPGPDYPKCENDDHCKKDKDGKELNEYCLFGQCQECAKDSHCKAGDKCNRGRCEKACTDDAACGDGSICEDAFCAPAQCTPSKPCGGGQECKAGRCEAPATTSTTGGGTTPVAGTADCAREATVPFDFNVHDLRPDARSSLDNFAKCLQQNSAWKLLIAGHADERGTTDYNLQLGERRANSIREYLVRLGVEKARVRTLSYGEEKPLDSSGTEEAFAKNRRGELTVQ